MKRQNNCSSFKMKVKFYHQELSPDGINNKTYWIITEVKDNLPIRTYYYEIPEEYKSDALLGEMHEKYCPYCPN